MNRTIEDAGRVPHPWLEPEPVSQDIRPPLGWKSDEDNWANIQTFMASGLGRR